MEALRALIEGQLPYLPFSGELKHVQESYESFQQLSGGPSARVLVFAARALNAIG